LNRSPVKKLLPAVRWHNVDFRINVVIAAYEPGSYFFVHFIMKKRSIKETIIGTYILAEVLLLLSFGSYFLLFTKTQDWEMFSYNFYGSFMLFSISCLIALLLKLLFKINKLAVIGVMLFIIPDLVSRIVGSSIYMTILKNNFVNIIYPLSVIIAFLAVIIHGNIKSV
jgi:hypothetical protein